MPYTETKKVNSEIGINKKTALEMSQWKGPKVYDLFGLANRIRDKYRGNKVDLCSIVNARSGACPEDCSFCAQSVHNNTDAEVYPLLTREKILRAADDAKKKSVKRFCIVTSGKRTSGSDLEAVCGLISEIRDMGILPCATLGMLDYGELNQLKDAGLNRYHHNLETSEAYFSEICTTHTYREKIETLNAARSLALSVCSGGIFGLGESWDDRIDMAFALKEIGVDSIPVNFLTPVNGTPMGNREMLSPVEALKIIAIYRLILPDREIRICGGRPATLRDLNAYIFFAGADGFLLGNYLTTPGRNPEDDLRMISDLGLEI